MKFMRENILRLCIFVSVLISFNVSVSAGTLKPVKEKTNRKEVKKLKEKAKKYNKLSFALVELIDKVEKKGSSNAIQFAKNKGFRVKKDNKIIVIVEAKNKSEVELVKSLIHQKEGKVLSKYNNLLKIEINITNLGKLNEIKKIKRVRKPYKPVPHAIDGEQINLTGAGLAMSNGCSGQGIKVAVIDGGFANLSASIASGELPNNVITNDFSGSGLTTGSEHGTAVAEVIYEMATNVQLYLLKIADSVDLGNAKDYCKANGIHIINHSMGWVNSEWGRGDGPICAIANDANDNGILWVNSAGNSAQRHWQESFNDSDSDTYHEFTGPSTNGEINEIGVLSAGITVGIFLCWDDTWGASGNDYDLELYYWNGAFWQWITGSYNWQNGDDNPVESIYGSVSSNGIYGVKINKFSGADKELQLFSFYQDFENQTPEKSLMAPAYATGVLTVGAVEYSDWSASGSVENFSSRGPNQAGVIKPDICGVDGNTNFIYGRFYGTSSASPCVAGTAALIWSGYSVNDNGKVRAHLENDAIDMYIAGKDNDSGHGLVDVIINVKGIPSIPTDEGDYKATSIQFDWNKSTISNTSSSFKYFVQICTNQSTPVVFSTNVGTNTSLVFAGIENEKIYYARVCGTNYYNKGNFSGWSDGITIDTTPPTLSGPPLDEGKWNTNENIVFHWTKAIDNESGVSNYCLVISTNTNIAGTVFSNNSLTATNYTYSSGINGKEYFAKVAAINGAGLKSVYSSWSDGITIDTTPPTLSGSPLDEGKWNTNENIVFHWVKAVDNESGVLNYSLVISTNTNISGTVFSNNSLTATNYTYSSGINGKEYFAKVAATNGAGLKSAYSPWSDGIIVDTTPPDLPASISVKSNESLGNVLYVVWTKSGSSDLDHYVVEYGTNKSTGLSTTNVGTITNVTLYPLLSGTLYYVRLYAYDNANNETNSTWYSNSTLNALPTLTSPNVTAPKVDGLNVKGKSSDTFTFQITYSDAEGNEPGLAGIVTNAVFLQIYTNDSSPAYATRVVYTNGGTINYTNGYIFTFTAVAAEQLELQTSATTKITNSLANICAAWTQVSYHWEAKAVEGNTNYVEYPTNTPYPTITIDDTPPAGVTVTENNITVDSAKIIWTASSSSDLVSSPYTLEWGTLITYGSSSSALSQTTKFYNITGLEQNTKYYYKLTISDDVGNTVEVTGDFSTIKVPGACVTEAYAYPSVADKGELIQFTYAKAGTGIKIYNITGALIKTVNANSYNIGEWTPNPDIAAGIYFAVYKNKAGEKKEVKFVYGIKK